MSDFDPYHKWLGISPQHQPPNHYRLLSLDLFESDPDVIEASVDRLAAYLQDVAAGPHASASQQLLNEIAAARLCLLEASEKAAYDARLQAEMSQEILPPAVSSPPAPPPAPPCEPAAVPAIIIDTGIASVVESRAVRKSTQSRASVTATTKRPPAARSTDEGSSNRRSPLLLLSFVSAGGLIVAAAIYALLANGEARRRAEEDARVRERYESFARMGREAESTLPDFTPNYEANPNPQPQKKKRNKRARKK